METRKIMAIVGSLRVSSVNRAVARAAVTQAAQLTQGPMLDIEIYPVASIPFYNGDVEDRGLPVSVSALHEAAAAADGLIFFTPEYNGSFPAVTKNVIDWLSRPPRGWHGKPVTAISATPGPRAGMGVRTAFTQLCKYQFVSDFEETFGIGEYPEKIGETGELADPGALADLRGFLARFAAWVETVAQQPVEERA